MNQNGKIIDEFKEINFMKQQVSDPTISSGRALIEPVHSAAITPVFYE